MNILCVSTRALASTGAAAAACGRFMNEIAQTHAHAQGGHLVTCVCVNKLILGDVFSFFFYYEEAQTFFFDVLSYLYDMNEKGRT